MLTLEELNGIYIAQYDHFSREIQELQLLVAQVLSSHFLDSNNIYTTLLNPRVASDIAVDLPKLLLLVLTS